MASENPIEPFVAHQGAMVLDGGLATSLEAMGCDLNDELWSAKVLLQAPDLIRQAHLDFLAAGADCITTATYQATIPGFHRRGLTEGEGNGLLRKAVQIAIEARGEFWDEAHNRRGRIRPLVAASIGPYGAYLADGSEYTGQYDIDGEDLYAFHRDRWKTLANTEVDLMACETIPSITEAHVLLQLVRETPNRWGWISFSCRDDAHLSDGSSFADAVRACDTTEGVAAVGINCTSPDLISPLISVARRATDKPIIVYPNSGEGYEAADKSWVGTPGIGDWGTAGKRWIEEGATGVGGCCRVSPRQISEIHQAVVG